MGTAVDESHTRTRRHAAPVVTSLAFLGMAKRESKRIKRAGRDEKTTSWLAANVGPFSSPAVTWSRAARRPAVSSRSGRVACRPSFHGKDQCVGNWSMVVLVGVIGRESSGRRRSENLGNSANSERTVTPG